MANSILPARLALRGRVRAIAEVRCVIYIINRMSRTWSFFNISSFLSVFMAYIFPVSVFCTNRTYNTHIRLHTTNQYKFTYLTERALTDDLDSPEVIQPELCSPQAQERRLLLPMLVQQPLLPLVRHQRVSLDLPLHLDPPTEPSVITAPATRRVPTHRVLRSMAASTAIL